MDADVTSCVKHRRSLPIMPVHTRIANVGTGREHGHMVQRQSPEARYELIEDDGAANRDAAAEAAGKLLPVTICSTE